MPNLVNSVLIKPVLHESGKNSESMGADEQVVEEPPKFIRILKLFTQVS